MQITTWRPKILIKIKYSSVYIKSQNNTFFARINFNFILLFAFFFLWCILQTCNVRYKKKKKNAKQAHL